MVANTVYYYRKAVVFTRCHILPISGLYGQGNICISLIKTEATFNLFLTFIGKTREQEGRIRGADTEVFHPLVQFSNTDGI